MTAALKFKVLYDVFVGEKVDYDDLKVFGCLAVAHNSTHGTNKFVPRSITCAFIGYIDKNAGKNLM